MSPKTMTKQLAARCSVGLHLSRNENNRTGISIAQTTCILNASQNVQFYNVVRPYHNSFPF